MAATHLQKMTQDYVTSSLLMATVQKHLGTEETNAGLL